ncbi:MAG TPA: phosphatase PAP2 family protein [Acidimicrobiales bacterium]|nr:phosphatase PAP2 family protein [Acidimicrobiales bacterium]
MASAAVIWALVADGSEGASRATDRVDAAILRRVARLRAGWLTDVCDRIDRVGSGWTLTVVALGLIVSLMIFKRWRHLFTFVGGVAVFEIFGVFLHQMLDRPRPYDVTTIGRWAGFSSPSPPVAVLTAVVVGIVYSLVVAGSARTIAKAVAAVVVIVFAGARIYLAVDHPFDVVLGVTLPVALLVNAFRWFTPNEAFPVTYRRGKTAHLNVGGRRGEAIRRAMRDQMGLTVLNVKPVGLESSGGSTPLRLQIADDPPAYLFGKLYAMSHVRADRWYKLGRTIVYGRLEDEAPFQSVRRLVEYEDYTLRLLRDMGIPTATPGGIVELTPEREYMLVTEFIDGASEMGEAVVDDGVIDEGLLIVRRLWDAGLAHRDIKPANLLVRDGQVLLIDAFFVQVRPSPWRQAVDLANMMLVLAVRTDAERVYRRAVVHFTPDDIAEAFAAARGVASPTQLRTLMKRDGRDLVAQFRAMAPERRPISLQRWSVKRVLIALGVLAGASLAAAQTTSMLTPADLPVTGSPTCGTDNLMILIAQAVPTATSVPCIASFPAGWHLGGVRVRHDQARFWLNSDRGGEHAVEATLLPPEDCTVDNATEVPSDEPGTRRYEQPDQLPPGLRSTRYYVFPGGCVTYRFAFSGRASAALIFDADSALSFQPRAILVDAVQERSGLRLCGAGAECPGGS